MAFKPYNSLRSLPPPAYEQSVVVQARCQPAVWKHCRCSLQINVVDLLHCNGQPDNDYSSLGQLWSLHYVYAGVSREFQYDSADGDSQI